MGQNDTIDSIIETYVPCTTIVGTIHGRDAIYLDTAQYAPSETSITLVGELNSSLCSAPPSGVEWLAYVLIFRGVVAFRTTEIDLSGWRGTSSFDEVRDSAWLRRLRAQDRTQRLGPRHRHYYVMTYDDGFDIIAKSYHLEIKVGSMSQA